MIKLINGYHISSIDYADNSVILCENTLFIKAVKEHILKNHFLKDISVFTPFDFYRKLYEKISRKTVISETDAVYVLFDIVYKMSGSLKNFRLCENSFSAFVDARNVLKDIFKFIDFILANYRESYVLKDVINDCGDTVNFELEDIVKIKDGFLNVLDERGWVIPSLLIQEINELPKDALNKLMLSDKIILTDYLYPSAAEREIYSALSAQKEIEFYFNFLNPQNLKNYPVSKLISKDELSDAAPVSAQPPSVYFPVDESEAADAVSGLVLSLKKETALNDIAVVASNAEDKKNIYYAFLKYGIPSAVSVKERNLISDLAEMYMDLIEKFDIETYFYFKQHPLVTKKGINEIYEIENIYYKHKINYPPSDDEIIKLTEEHFKRVKNDELKTKLLEFNGELKRDVEKFLSLREGKSADFIKHMKDFLKSAFENLNSYFKNFQNPASKTALKTFSLLMNELDGAADEHLKIKSYINASFFEFFKDKISEIVSGAGYIADYSQSVNIFDYSEFYPGEFKHIIMYSFTQESFAAEGETLGFVSPDFDYLKYSLKNKLDEASYFLEALLSGASLKNIFIPQFYDNLRAQPSTLLEKYKNDFSPQDVSSIKKGVLPQTPLNHYYALMLEKYKLSRKEHSFNEYDGALGTAVDAANRLSITKISNYVYCPFKYFLETVAGIKPLFKLTAALEKIDYGSLLHSIVKDVYGSYKGKRLSEIDKKELENKFKDVCASYLKKIEPLVSKDVLLNYKKDIYGDISGEFEGPSICSNLMELFSASDNEINEVEKDYSCVINLKEKTASKNLKFKLRIDRIDKTDTGYLIIDYKTGRIENKSFNYFLKGAEFQSVIYALKLLEEEKKDASFSYVELKADIKKDVSKMMKSILNADSAVRTKIGNSKIRVKKETLQKLLAFHLINIIKMMESGFFVYMPSNCASCGYSNVCRCDALKYNAVKKTLSYIPGENSGVKDLFDEARREEKQKAESASEDNYEKEIKIWEDAGKPKGKPKKPKKVSEVLVSEEILKKYLKEVFDYDCKII